MAVRALAVRRGRIQTSAAVSRSTSLARASQVPVADGEPGGQVAGILAHRRPISPTGRQEDPDGDDERDHRRPAEQRDPDAS